MALGRPKATLVLTDRDREQLEELVSSYSSPGHLVNRARVILLSASGMTNRQIARQLGIANATVSKWRSRFIRLGLAGLDGELCPGRSCSPNGECDAQPLAQTLPSRPTQTEASRLNPIGGFRSRISEAARHCARPLFAAALAAIFCLSGWVAYLTWPRKLNITLPPCLPVVEAEGNRLAVHVRTDALLAQVGNYHSELEAYLHLEYIKSQLGLASPRILLTVKSGEAAPRYQIFLVLDNNLLADIPYLSHAWAKGYIPHYSLHPVSFQDLARKRLETAVFLGSYNPTRTPQLASLPQSRLLVPLASFLVFKSRTDRRVREHIPPIPTTLSFGQAKELASDILDVVHFYNLPLDVFLGIGAMENNYMNVRGDLDHSVWKRRAQRGDIVLKHARGRVLVSDYAMGVWQITRETLRRAHALYLKDKRDYSALPPRLRPARRLSFDLDNSEVLTTYAGLLLRHLLDKSNDDIAKAVGAYNGSLRRPNYQYAAGVEAVALYARDFLERAANLGGLNVAKSWLVHPPHFNQGEEVATNESAIPRRDLNLGSH